MARAGRTLTLINVRTIRHESPLGFPIIFAMLWRCFRPRMCFTAHDISKLQSGVLFRQRVGTLLPSSSSCAVRRPEFPK